VSSYEDDVIKVVSSIVNRAPGWRDWFLDDVISKALGDNPLSASNQYKVLNSAVDCIKSLSSTPAYRTLLAFNSAAKIAGENLILKKRLECEILELLDESSLGSTASSGTLKVSDESLFSYPIYPKPPDSKQNSNPTPPPLVQPKSSFNQKYKDKKPSLWDSPQTQRDDSKLSYGQIVPSDDENVDVAELFTLGIEVSVDAFLNKKKVRKGNDDNIDRIFTPPEYETDEIFTQRADVNVKNITDSLQIADIRRVGDAELILLLIYINFPAFHSSVSEIVRKIEGLKRLESESVRGFTREAADYELQIDQQERSVSAWTDPVCWSIWNEISEISSENILESASQRVKSLIASNSNLFNRICVDTEVILRTAEKTLMEWHSKKSQMNLVRSISDFLDPTVINIEELNVPQKLEGKSVSELSKFETDLYSFSEEASKLEVLLWQKFDSNRDETFRNSSNLADRFELEESDIIKSSYDIESVAAEAFLEANTNPNEYNVDTNEEIIYPGHNVLSNVYSHEEETNEDRYQFEFLAANMVLSEEEAKVEDNRIKELAKIYAETTSSEDGNDKPPGYTIGIDDIYEDSYVYKNPKSGRFQEGSYSKFQKGRGVVKRKDQTPQRKLSQETYATPESLAELRNSVSTRKDSIKSEWFGTYQHKHVNNKHAVNNVGPPGQPKPPPKRQEIGEEIQDGKFKYLPLCYLFITFCEIFSFNARCTYVFTRWWLARYRRLFSQMGR